LVGCRGRGKNQTTRREGRGKCFWGGTRDSKNDHREEGGDNTERNRVFFKNSREGEDGS